MDSNVHSSNLWIKIRNLNILKIKNLSYSKTYTDKIFLYKEITKQMKRCQIYSKKITSKSLFLYSKLVYYDFFLKNISAIGVNKAIITK